MSWLDTQVSLYSCPADNTGRASTFRDILFTEFAVPHEWYLKLYKPEEKWISDTFNDIDTINDLRTREMTKEEKVMLKNTLQCFTPAALLKSKKKGQVEEISRTGLMQLDFDAAAIQEYDIEELKQVVFNLPFIAFCGLSVSGNGFYALAKIAEPEKLPQYAEHCFEVLNRYNLPPDTTKGRNVNDLRFVSYDCNMLYRENPEPLKIKQFKPKPKPVYTSTTPITITHANKMVADGLKQISNAMEGNRFKTVQRVAFTFGGLGDNSLLDAINGTINNTAAFHGQEEKYCRCAADCFEAGKQKPLQAA